MEIGIPPKLLAALTVTGVSRGVERLIQSWQVGQALTATVLRTLGNGHAELRIGGQVVRATTDISLSRGQELAVKVVRTGDKPVLQITELGDSPAATLARALRVALPRQGPLTPLLANLNLLAQTPDRVPVPLPVEVIAAARELVNRLPSAQSLATANGLKRAIEDSGLFLEARLARLGMSHETQGPGADLKAALLRLLHNLATARRNARPIPPSSPSSVPTREPTRRDPASPPPAPNRGHAQASLSSPGNSNTPDRPTASTYHAGRPTGAGTRLPIPTTPAAGGPTSDNAGRRAAIGGVQPRAPTATTVPLTPDQAPAKGSPVREPMPSRQATATQPSAHRATSPTPNLPEHTSLSRALGDLARQAGEGLARLQVHQLSAVATEEAPRPALVVELPVRHLDRLDVFRMQIEEDTSRDGSTETRSWRVTLSFELTELGRVNAVVSVLGDQVATDICAEQPATTRLFDTHLEHLRSRLCEAGLAVGRLTCRTGGSPPQMTPAQTRALLDLRA